MNTMDYTRLPDFGVPAAPDPVEPEFAATVAALEECNLEAPQDVSTYTLIAGVGRAFLPEELPAAEHLTEASEETRQYFDKVLQPALEKGVRLSDPRVLGLAYQLGRLLAANSRAQDFKNTNPPLEVTPRNIYVDGRVVPFSIETGNVIEYGMGVNGLFTHFRNVGAGRYSITSIQKTRGEKAVLEGMADYFGITDDQMTILDRGIGYRMGGLLASGGHQSADLIVASRVHGAGADLKTGIAKGSRLIRIGGLLVARGPRTAKGTVGYDEVATQINRLPNMGMVLDHEFIEDGPRGRQEPSRLIVAERF